MKKLLLASLAAGGLLGLTGCCSTDRDQSVSRQISRQLDCGGTFYLVADQTGVVKTVLKTLDEVDAAVKKSDFPEDRKAAIGKGINVGLRVIRELGLEGEIGAGASSIAFTVPGRPETMYRNRYVNFHRNPENAIFWNLSGTENRDLSADMAALPGNTLLAADFMLYPDQLIGLFREVEAEINGGAPSVLNPQVEEIIRGISGNWGLLVTDNGDDACPIGIMLVIPDKDAKVFNLIAMLTGQTPADPARPGGFIELELPDFCSDLNVRPVIQYLGDAIAVYSDEALIETLTGAEKLAACPDFAALKHRLPEQGLGFFYSGPGIGEILSELVGRSTGLDLTIDIPSQLTVWERTGTGLAATQNSRWDINHWQIAMQFFPAAAMMLRPACEMFMSGAFETYGEEGGLAGAAQDVAIQAQMALIGAALQEYAARHDGKFPAGADIDGLKELLKATDLDAALLQCPMPGEDELTVEADALTYDRCSFIYFAGNTRESNPKLPLLVSWPYGGRNSFHVFLVDGDQVTCEAEDLSDCRRLVSILQSRFKYSEADLNRLLGTADKLDALFAL